MARVPKKEFNELRGTDWTYKDVADKMGLDPEKFDHLMSERFDTDENGKEGRTFHLSYTMEWAQRVSRSDPYQMADEETAEVMEEAGY